MINIRYRFSGTALCLCCFLLITGCGGMNKATTGAAAGAGIGALAGQLIGHNTAGTLIGAGVGMGLGYIIGNELDKQKVAKQQTVAENETKPLADTTWQIVKVTPKPKQKDPYTSRVSHFKTDGTVISTLMKPDGKVEITNERYRIVGSTLIINHDDYIINARFRIDGRQMILDTGKYSMVLQRLDS
ncbi:MAG: hypothetical protein KBG09_06625 [Syntrophobacterales bacterium]|nr:hypothetical protein [Syntrophobacterales bacterium]